MIESDLNLADRLEQAAKDMRKAAHPSRMGSVPDSALSEMLFQTEITLKFLAVKLRERATEQTAELDGESGEILEFPER